MDGTTERNHTFLPLIKSDATRPGWRNGDSCPWLLELFDWPRRIWMWRDWEKGDLLREMAACKTYWLFKSVVRQRWTVPSQHLLERPLAVQPLLQDVAVLRLLCTLEALLQLCEQGCCSLLKFCTSAGKPWLHMCVATPKGRSIRSLKVQWIAL